MDYFLYDRARTSTISTLEINRLSKRILVVGDQTETGRIAEVFEVSLHDVDTAHNGPEAIRKIMSHDFDIVVFHMAAREIPVEMFYLALQRIRPRLSEHLVLITNAGLASRLTNFAHEHAGAVVCEPYAEEDLLETISSLACTGRTTFRG